jgi:hypothetical protein
MSNIEKYKNDTTLEILKRYAMDNEDEVTLTETQQKRWERVVFVDSLFQQSYNGPQIATMVHKRYDISERQAYTDIAFSQAIFGGIRKPNAEYVSAIFFDKIQDALRRAKNNLKIEADLLKTFGKYAADLKNSEQNQPDVPKMIVIVTRPEDVGLEPVNIEKLKREFERRNTTEKFEDATIVE